MRVAEPAAHVNVLSRALLSKSILCTSNICAIRRQDTLLTEPAGRSDCLLRLCIAMLTHVRLELLEVGFNRPQQCLLRPDPAMKFCKPHLF